MRKYKNIEITSVAALSLLSCVNPSSQPEQRPNIILIMADDLGYGDVGCYGNKTALTPCLDSMATQGIKFERFYAAAPVSSPTRASCLTGRHPYRTGVPWAGAGYLKRDEITIAEALKTAGYATGHFGKWHVGGMSKTVKQGYFPGDVKPEYYSPPWENGFDESFSTYAQMPTYNPYYMVGGAFEAENFKFVMDQPVAKGQRTGGFRYRDFYWRGEGQIVDEWLDGDDSKFITDEALAFIERKAKEKTPFLSVIWFHTPHTPVVAGEDMRGLYPNESMEEQHWFGSITAMDKQIGRLRAELRTQGIADNTILWFCSDNGPSYIHDYNSAGGLRGKKAELWEGGIRVPAILEYPAKIKQSTISKLPTSTSDFYSSVLSVCGVEKLPNQPLLDGNNVFPLLFAQKEQRDDYLFFQSPLPNRLKKSESNEEEEQMAVISNRWKIISMDNGESFQLYDLAKDPSETADLSEQNAVQKEKMLTALRQWQKTLLR